MRTSDNRYRATDTPVWQHTPRSIDTDNRKILVDEQEYKFLQRVAEKADDLTYARANPHFAVINGGHVELREGLERALRQYHDRVNDVDTTFP